MRFRFSIRLQLLVLSLFLFAIPYLGYKYVWELEQYLRIGQEQTMIGTARAVATALHERPALFDSQSAYLQNVRPGTDLYAPPRAEHVAFGDALLRASDVALSMCMVEDDDFKRVIQYQKYRDGELSIDNSALVWDVDTGYIKEDTRFIGEF